ncbi:MULTISPECIES: TIGR03943 family putative permease subunit [Enterococcus]|uniref:TIGR03943 family putative permease subunit n=1 Tax=Enterococcus TaxID=1350 RepID=UPI001E328C2A|nr:MULTISPECIES: TIGR03943 family protein [Enterococcus]MCD1024053.1 TIGR03943 family protein [Enterococcus sp. SMC-9]MDT2739517.1 TIGR03943 family protein [Enterococcus canintestini]
MIRFLILAGYFELMMYLQVSGKLNQFINVHYSYLAILSMILSFVLAMVQLVLWVKADGKKEDSVEHSHEEGIEHEHGLKKRHQRVIAYILLALPVIVGTFFPVVSLDTTIVQAKGFQFPISKESVGDPQMQTQYLQPNTSMYYNKTEYQKQMDKLMKKYDKSGTLAVTEENYLEIMELIYNYPSEFIGRKISFDGFIYHAKQDQKEDDFVFRFGIIHCVADSGVFGLRIHLPAGSSFKNDQWVHIEGVIQSNFYQPLKRELPVVQTMKTSTITAPKNQYVYRSF